MLYVVMREALHHFSQLCQVRDIMPLRDMDRNLSVEAVSSV
jgi:hypothetical protein